MTEWEAGAALDAEIARRVFGAACHTFPDETLWAQLPKRGWAEFAPSRNIAAAWTVLEHFQQKGQRVHVQWDATGEQWLATIEEPQPNGDALWHLEAGCTAPMAICRTALEAAGQAAADAPGER